MAAGELMLAAAHNTDLDAAQRAGLATAFISADRARAGSDERPRTDWFVGHPRHEYRLPRLTALRAALTGVQALGIRGPPHVLEAISDPADSTACR